LNDFWEVRFDLLIFDGGDAAIDHLHLFGDDIQGDHFVVLRQKQPVAKAYVSGSCDGYFHLFSFFFLS